MALIPWKPFSDLDSFFRDDDWMFPVVSRKELTMPAMDVYEKDNNVVAEVSIPDFDPSKINVFVEDGVLRVSGTAEEKKEEKDKGYWKKEIRRGSFERAVRLPADVKEDAVDATYEKGVLKIVMPKVETKPASKIKIKVKDSK